MLTAAQMFLLKTCAALPFSSWMWSSATSSSAVLSTGSHQQAGDALGWSWDLAPHPLLDPGEDAWEQTQPPSSEPPKPTSRLRM